ncbi:MAG: hypothetical protein JO115_14960 [Pseudonocardiales bacterium]|nr:hypothetical protein [Pseudonocardiales bacterium]
MTGGVFHDVVDQYHRVRGSAPPFDPPQSATVRPSKIFQERVHEQSIDLVRILRLPDALGKPLSEAQEGHRLPWRQILLVHEPSISAPETRNSSRYRGTEEDFGHYPPNQPNRQPISRTKINVLDTASIIILASRRSVTFAKKRDDLPGAIFGSQLG